MPIIISARSMVVMSAFWLFRRWLSMWRHSQGHHRVLQDDGGQHPAIDAFGIGAQLFQFLNGMAQHGRLDMAKVSRPTVQVA
ncbi:MAG: hypothetical protein IPP18_15770 [Rhodocyclaceae bacterium]|nr:hypothetical protein [Rhodocyclaceae bacterium]